MEANRISVLIPVHNMGYAISRALESLVNQTNQSFDVVIALDACTDNTESVINSYEDKLNITYFNVFYRNVSKVRDELIDHLYTDLYTFLDADDELTTDAIETALTIPEEAQYVRFGKVVQFLDGTETRYHPFEVAQFVHGVIFKRSAIARYGLRFDDLQLNEDVKYMGCLTLSALANDDNFQDTLSDRVIYIQHENGQSTTHTTTKLHSLLQVKEAFKQIYGHFKSLCRNPKEQQVLTAMGLMFLLKWGIVQRMINKNLSPLRYMHDEVKRYEVSSTKWNDLVKMYVYQQMQSGLITNDEADQINRYFKM